MHSPGAPAGGCWLRLHHSPSGRRQLRHLRPNLILQTALQHQWHSCCAAQGHRHWSMLPVLQLLLPAAACGCWRATAADAACCWSIAMKGAQTACCGQCRAAQQRTTKFGWLDHPAHFDRLAPSCTNHDPQKALSSFGLATCCFASVLVLVNASRSTVLYKVLARWQAGRSNGSNTLS